MKKFVNSCRLRSFSTSSITKVIAHTLDNGMALRPSISPTKASPSLTAIQAPPSMTVAACSNSLPNLMPGPLTDTRSRSFSTSLPDSLSRSCRDSCCQETPSLGSIKRYNSLQELVATETTYTSSLRKMLKYYKEPLKSILSELEIASIFSISELIYDFHCSLLSGLTERVEKWNEEVLIGGFLIQMVSFLRSYSAYISNFTLAMNTLAQCEKRLPFQSMMGGIRNTLTDDGRIIQSLPSYLMMPIQRIPRYLLLLEDLRANTPDDHPDAQHLQKACAIVSEILAYMDSKSDCY